MLVVADEGTKDDPLPAQMLRNRVAFFMFEDSLTNGAPAPGLEYARIKRARLLPVLKRIPNLLRLSFLWRNALA